MRSFPGLPLAAIVMTAPALGAGVPANVANPLVAEWTTPDGVPPYDRIQLADYEPAFDAALQQGRAAYAAIAANKDAPDFANTLEAMERATPLLDRISATFFTIASADATPAVQKIEERITPQLTRFSSEIYLNPQLFARIDALKQREATLGLTPEQARLLEIIHLRFTRAGAALPEPQRQRLAAIAEEMSQLKVQFSQNLLADQKAAETFLTEAEVAGLSSEMQAAAAAKATAAGREGLYLISATRSDVEPFLTVATDREARKKVFTAFDMRGDKGNANDNNAIITHLLRLRLERAQMLGHATHADYVLENSMAKTPRAATDLMMRVYEAARRRALGEAAELQTLAGSDGIDRIEPWDWRFYAEKLRKERYAFDEARLQAYLPLDGMVAALFDAANRLYGVRMTPRTDVPVYADGVRVWEVSDTDGKQIGLFYADWFTRDTKRPGAWMNALRTQNGLTGQPPIVVNNANFIPPSQGGRATLSLDDADTLFHEFGHALHGLLSKTRYPSLAGTAVYRDFVEFPSQINEQWLRNPELLAKYAVNEKGEPLPAELIDALIRSKSFNQGFLTAQQLSSALVDMRLHEQSAYPDDFDPRAFEQQTLAALQLPPMVGMRHRLAHFSHLFDSAYDASYYAYTWAEVLEADGFDAFLEAGGPWDRNVATRYRTEILERGNSRDPAQSYVAFRGRMPEPTALLRNRGLE